MEGFCNDSYTFDKVETGLFITFMMMVMTEALDLFLRAGRGLARLLQERRVRGWRTLK